MYKLNKIERKKGFIVSLEGQGGDEEEQGGDEEERGGGVRWRQLDLFLLGSQSSAAAPLQCTVARPEQSRACVSLNKHGAAQAIMLCLKAEHFNAEQA